MDRTQQTLTDPVGTDLSALLVITTGLAVSQSGTGWQVTWLLVLAAVALAHRYGPSLGALAPQPTTPHSPNGP